MVTIDRFEGSMAVLDWEGVIFSIPRGLIPAEAREGDVITLDIKVEKEATALRKKHINELEKRLFQEG